MDAGIGNINRARDVLGLGYFRVSGILGYSRARHVLEYSRAMGVHG